MCGRFALTAPASRIAEVFGVDVSFDLLPRTNIAPSQEVLSLLGTGDARSLAMLRWGLIPSWAKDRKIGYRTLNARSETVASKPAFRSAFKRSRCAVLADGFYEWKRLSKTDKRPHLFRLSSGDPFGMAGLWAKWTDPETGEEVRSASILTTSGNALMKPIHDRMPVILGPRQLDLWLADDTSPAELQALLRPYDAAQMTVREVSKYVNNARHEGPMCQEPPGLEQERRATPKSEDTQEV